MHQLTKLNLKAVLRFMGAHRQFISLHSTAAYCEMTTEKLQMLVSDAERNTMSGDSWLDLNLERLTNAQADALREFGVKFGVLTAGGEYRIDSLRTYIDLGEYEGAKLYPTDASFKKHIQEGLTISIGRALLEAGIVEFHEGQRGRELRVEAMLRFLKSDKS
jgi:hypothetical protein